MSSIKKIVLKVSTAHFSNYLKYTDTKLNTGKTGDFAIMSVNDKDIETVIYDNDRTFMRYTKIPYNMLMPSSDTGTLGIDSSIILPVMSISKLSSIVSMLSKNDEIDIAIGYVDQGMEVDGSDAMMKVAKVIQFKASNFTHKTACMDMSMGIEYIGKSKWRKLADVSRHSLRMDMTPEYLAFLEEAMSLDKYDMFRMVVGDGKISFKSIDATTSLDYDGNNTVNTNENMDVKVNKKNFFKLLAKDKDVISEVHLVDKKLVTVQGDTVTINSISL